MTNIVNKYDAHPLPRLRSPGRIRGLLVRAACAATIACGVGYHPVAFASIVLPPCVFEDDSWCTWDARLQGNGVGHSFVALGGETIVPDHYILNSYR